MKSERSQIDLKTRLELQGKLLADHSDNLSNAQSQIEKLKNKLEVEVDLKSQLELQGKLIHLSLSSKTAIFLQVDERSKTDMKMEIDRQGKLLVDQIILQKNLERTQLEIEKLKHTLQVERCAQEEDMDKQVDQEMFLINSDISMEAEVGVNEPKTLFDPQMDLRTQNQQFITLYISFQKVLTTENYISMLENFQ